MKNFRLLHVSFLAPLCLLTGAALAINAATPPQFQLALPGYKYSFPRDNASHPAYGTEWWYYTGHLTSKSGRHFGYELTFFRVALRPAPPVRRSAWAARDVILGHFAITDETNGTYYYCDRAERAAVGLAGADATTPRVWLGNWNLRFDRTGQHLAARDRSVGGDKNGLPMAIDLTQIALKPPVINGINGVSQKSAGRGHASHYYSYTRLRTTGTLKLGDESFTISGQSWFDKEFGSGSLGQGQVGWDWFSIQLNDGREIMLYRMRRNGGGHDPYSSGTLVERNGSSRHLVSTDFQLSALSWWISPATKARYPAKWSVSLPREGLDMTITPTVADQELVTTRSTNVTYWEGSAGVAADRGSRPAVGVAYVELTGYGNA